MEKWVQVLFVLCCAIVCHAEGKEAKIGLKAVPSPARGAWRPI